MRVEVGLEQVHANQARILDILANQARVLEFLEHERRPGE